MPTPIGLKIPIRLGNTGYFEQTFTSIDEAKSNIYNLLLTQKGERIMQPNFGTSIHRLLFNQIDSNIANDLESEIRNAIEVWIPYITLVNIEVNISDDNKENNKIEVKLEFGLTRDLNQSEEIVLSFAT